MGKCFLTLCAFCPVSWEPQHPKKLNPSIMCNDCKVLAEASRNDKGLLHLHQYFSPSAKLGPDFYWLLSLLRLPAALPGDIGATVQSKYRLGATRTQRGEKCVDSECRLRARGRAHIPFYSNKGFNLRSQTWGLNSCIQIGSQTECQAPCLSPSSLTSTKVKVTPTSWFIEIIWEWPYKIEIER